VKPARYVANFDSEAAMLRALGNYLHGEDFPMTGSMPRRVEPLVKALVTVVNALPGRLREEVYTWSGRSEAVPPKKLGQVRAEDVSRWVVNHYPRRHYPAAVIGSSNGALVHLCCALGIPWLPQTFLVPVRRSGLHPDEPAEEMEWGREPAHDQRWNPYVRELPGSGPAEVPQGFRDVRPLPHGPEEVAHALSCAWIARPLPARRVPRLDG